MSKSDALEEFAEERRRFIRDGDDFVRCLTIEFEIELGLGSTIAFSLAKTKIVSPSAMCLPPYIVFCAVNRTSPPTDRQPPL